MGELISIVSFLMAVIGALAAVFINNRDKQTMAAVVGVAFLVSFFINVSRDSQLILQAAAIIAFIISVIGGTVAIFSNEESKRSGAIVTGVMSLGTSPHPFLVFGISSILTISLNFGHFTKARAPIFFQNIG